MTHPWPDIRELEFVGGCLCFDFVNTTGTRQTTPRERLHDYSDWIVFARRAGLIGQSKAKALKSQSVQTPREAKRAFNRILKFRESLYRILVAAIQNRAAEESDLEVFNQWLHASGKYRQLTWGKGKPVWVWLSPADDWIAPCYQIVDSAAELLQSPELSSAKKCGDCDWLFLDVSRNQRRQWCKKTCGDRVKSRNYYQRKKKLKRKN